LDDPGTEHWQPAGRFELTLPHDEIELSYLVAAKPLAPSSDAAPIELHQAIAEPLGIIRRAITPVATPGPRA